MFAFGYGSYGQLGIGIDGDGSHGSNVHILIPHIIPCISNATAIVAGNNYSIVLKEGNMLMFGKCSNNDLPINITPVYVMDKYKKIANVTAIYAGPSPTPIKFPDG